VTTSHCVLRCSDT